jgi:hypothetical protein
MLQFAELGMLLPGDAASDGDYAFDIGIEQTFAQDALPDHARGAEQKNLHLFIIRPVRYSFTATTARKVKHQASRPS